MLEMHICPCGSENTCMEDDILFERDTIIRYCEACGSFYEVIFFPPAIKEVRKLGRSAEVRTT